jgi:NAD+ synthase (glutamine-hydrolysing)
VDVERLLQERRRMGTFQHCGGGETGPAGMPRLLRVDFASPDGGAAVTLERVVEKEPFVPVEAGVRTERCAEVVAMQAEGLARRLRHTGARCAVVGVSGGLDSTLALLVTLRSLALLGRDSRDALGVTMPGFGTTSRTHQNAAALVSALGATLKEVPIGKAAAAHLADIGHDGHTLDATYENAQARERTQVLMDLANMHGGLVVGTGDLSELALGWATYNGDHMSMYGVNSSVPKTLVRHLVAWFAETVYPGTPLEPLLRDILATPVSPELLPPRDGVIAQRTEDLVGPYVLHDFFLYYTLRWGFSPAKVFYLSRAAFVGCYDDAVIKGWMGVFYRRFFAQQFKRSCLPDGPKVGTVNLSPRGDWRMPSDASASAWLAEVEAL